MAEPGSDGNQASRTNVVFVDTSLDTHLALIVSDSDTVSDLKKKLLYEHPLCFPNIGKIQIHALKVKRKGYFYHLSDSMFVKSAFDGVQKNWFLGVDASRSVEHSENQHSLIPAAENNLLACFGIKNGTSFDRVDLPHDGPLKRPSNFDDSLLPLVEINQNAEENVPIADRYGSSDSGRGFFKEKDSSVNGFCKDASQQDIIVPEKSVIDAGREVSCDRRMGNKDIADEPCRSSSSNTSRRLVSKIKKTNNLSKETEVTENHGNCIIYKFKNDVDLQCNKSLEEVSQLRPRAKRKRKIEKKIRDQDFLQENRALTCDSYKETTKAEICSVGDQLKTTSILDSISTEPVEDVHLLDTGSSGKSKKRRKKSSNPPNQVLLEVPSSRKHVREENSSAAVGINHKDFGGEPGTAFVPRQGVQGAMTSELCEISMKEKQGDPVHEVGGNNKLPLSLVHKQKENATLDSLASEPFENVHLLGGTDSSSGKKKRKKKSSDPLNQVVAAVPSSGKDVKEESSRVTVGINLKDSSNEPYLAGDGVQSAMTSELCGISQKEKQHDPFHEVGENDKVPDLDMCDTDAGNMKSNHDASEEETAVGIERTRNSKDSHFVDLKGHPAVGVKELSNLQKDIELSRPENSVLNDDDKCGTDLTDRVEEERESSHNRDPKGMLSEKFKPPSRNETDMNAKEVIATSKSLDGTGIVKDRKSGKKGRNKRKNEDSVGGTPMKSGIEHVKCSEHDISSAEPDKTINGDYSSGKAKKEESNFYQIKEKEVSKTKTVSTSVLGTGQLNGDVNGDEVESLQHISKTQANAEKMDEKMRKKSSKTKTVNTYIFAAGRETSDVHGDAVESFQHISKTQANTENIDEKMKKKSKKKKNSAVKNLLDLQTKDQDVDHQGLTPSAYNQREVEASSKMTNEKQGSEGKSQAGNSSNIQLRGLLSKDECTEHMLHPEKKLLKVSRSEDSDGGRPIKSGMEHVKNSGPDVSSSQPHKTVNGDHSSDNAKKEEIIFSQIKGKEVSKAVSTSLLGAGQRTGDDNGDEMGSFQQISKTQENAENIDEKMKKKSKKKKISTAKNLLGLQTKDQDVGHQGPTPSAYSQRKVEASSKMTNEKQGSKGKSQAGNSSTIQLQGSLSKDECAEHMLHPEKKLLKVSRSEDSVGGRPIKSGVENVKSFGHDVSSSQPHKTVNGDHSSYNAKKEESNFSQTKGKEVSKTVSISLLGADRETGDDNGDEVESSQHISKTQANAENMDEKTRKKSKKKQNSASKNLLDLQTKDQDVGHKDPIPSANNQREVEASTKMTNDKQGSGVKSQAGKSSTIIQLQGSLSKDECAEHMLHPQKKLLKVSRSGTKAPRSGKSDKFTSIPDYARRPSIANASETSINSEKKSEGYAVSNSNLGTSKNIVHQNKLGNRSQSGAGRDVRKASVNDIGEVVNSSEREKSLLAKSGTIFKDDSSESSEDEDGVDNSDASTRTPLDDSFSSDYSDGESNGNLNSPQNGSYASKRKNGGGRSITKASSSSGAKSLTLDTILRSSSRYKKAKLTATQSQLDDTESQPVDHVPDSLADL